MKGLPRSQIGVILRDSHGVAQVRFVTGNIILLILKSKGLAPDLPEDLRIKKAVAVLKHLERSRKDKDAKFRFTLVESRIHRLARYYKSTEGMGNISSSRKPSELGEGDLGNAEELLLAPYEDGFSDLDGGVPLLHPGDKSPPYINS
ncbi:40S ribosomal protein S13 [Acipenser ruthenus]|uniref:40S ribosomal protein S13 n=1 Tax=Acipenser ruthenus TaxID=7906 RepID=A0A662YN22_ACIRT|nr:40S ribosomal protein S13 [Acipenser ruthenus]